MSPDAPFVCIFDLDDTLVRSPLDLRAMARDIEAEARRLGLPVPTRERRWSVVELIEVARAHAPETEPVLMEIAIRHEHDAMHQAQLEDGALAAVRAVRAAGYRTAVWTNNTRIVADHVLGRLGLAESIEFSVTRDESRVLKPDPAGLRLIQARWPGARGHVVIGDAWIEGVAAAALGVPFVAYRADREALRQWNVTPHHHLDSFDGLLPVLGTLFASPTGR